MKTKTKTAAPKAKAKPVLEKMTLIPVVDLFKDGNAFSILSRCHKAAKKAGWSDKQWEAFSDKAKGDDYDHFLQAVMEEFEEEFEEEAGWESTEDEDDED